jgi:hypothetical protein
MSATGLMPYKLARTVRAQLCHKPVLTSQRKCFVFAKASPDPDAGVSQMSLEEAEATLHVKRTADFDAIMRAKDMEMRKAADDPDKAFMVRDTDRCTRIVHSSDACPQALAIIATYGAVVPRLQTV